MQKFLDFMTIFPKNSFFYFVSQNHKIAKIRDSSFVNSIILYPIRGLCAVSLKTVLLLAVASQTFATFGPKMAEGGVTK